MPALSSPDRLDLVFALPAMNPYWARRLSELAKTTDLRFEVWLLAERGAGRAWVVSSQDMAFPYRLLRGGYPKQLCEAVKLYRRFRPRYLLTFHFVPKLWPAIIHAALPGNQLAFYAEKTWDSWIRRRWYKDAAKRLIFRTADVVFTPGQDAVQHLEAYTRSDTRFLRMPHAVDLDALADASTARQQAAQLRVLYLGRLVPEKGLRELIKAMDTVDESLAAEGVGSEAGVALRIVGDGPLLEELQEWAAGHHTAFRAEIHDFVQAGQLAPVFADADVLVFPTLGDPYGLVVNEAMAAGLPVISSKSAGEIEERIGIAEARGLLVEAGDPAGLAEALLRAFHDRPLIAAMGRRARAYAEQQFRFEEWVGSIVAWVRSQPT